MNIDTSTQIVDIKHVTKSRIIDVAKSLDDCASRVSKYDWNSHIAYKVCIAESGASTTVINWKDHHETCDGSVGLFQIACLHAPIENLKNADFNVDMAYKLYKKEGWKPWGVCSDGKVDCKM